MMGVYASNLLVLSAIEDNSVHDESYQRISKCITNVLELLFASFILIAEWPIFVTGPFFVTGL